ALYGWEEATSLAMTSATVGMLSAIVFGLYFIKRGSNTGKTNFLPSFTKLPTELRTGLVPEGKRKKTEIDTVSSVSIDPLIFHLAMVFGIAFIAYYISEWGLSVFRKILTSTGSDKYFSSDVFNKIGGGATDVLIAFGIASISLPVVAQFIIPLILLFIVGLFISWFFFSILSKSFFEEYAFERGIFT